MFFARPGGQKTISASIPCAGETLRVSPRKPGGSLARVKRRPQGALCGGEKNS
jgi:hypothetical protein